MEENRIRYYELCEEAEEYANTFLKNYVIPVEIRQIN